MQAYFVLNSMSVKSLRFRSQIVWNLSKFIFTGLGAQKNTKGPKKLKHGTFNEIELILLSSTRYTMILFISILGPF